MNNALDELSKITEQLNQLGYTLSSLHSSDEACLYKIFQEVVEDGSLFPYETSSLEEFHRLFLEGNVFICHSSTKEVVGGFYIKANFPGRSSHIANAAYMLRKDHRNKGIGSLLIKASLWLAQDLGYQAMQFNMVLSENSVAVKVYQKLGFTIIGTIPEAVRKPDGCYQDGYTMHRKLSNQR